MRVRIPGPRGWNYITVAEPIPQSIQARIDSGNAWIVDEPDAAPVIETAAMTPQRVSSLGRIRARATERLKEALRSADKLMTRGGERGRKIVACRLMG